MVFFTSDPIEPGRVFEMVERKDAGSVLFHFAVAKAMESEHGTTSRINYQRNGEVERNLGEIAGELKEKWNLTDVLLVRRQGTVEVGEIISLVAVSAPGSEAAFAACRYGLTCLKQMTTIQKTEFYS